MSKINTLVQDLLASSAFARWFVPFLGWATLVPCGTHPPVARACTQTSEVF